MEVSQRKASWYFLSLVVLSYLAAWFTGGAMGTNNWSFSHWQYLPASIIGSWIVIFVASSMIFSLVPIVTERGFSSQWKVRLGLGLLLISFYFFRFDSFLFGDGNLKVNQTAIEQYSFGAWYEYGVIWSVRILGTLWEQAGFLFDGMIDYRVRLTAGVYGWQTFAFTCSLVSLIGAAKLAARLSQDRARQWMLFVILFFGPQTALYFGYIGVQTVIVPFTIWTALYAFKTLDEFTTNRLLMFWAIWVVGMVFHISMLYLLPAVVYVSLSSFLKTAQKQKMILAATIGVMIVMTAGVYYYARTDFGFSQYLLYFNGQNPHSDYGLLSGRHLGDVAQALFLLAPQAILLLYFLLGRREPAIDKTTYAFGFMAIAGIIVFFISNPVAGMPLDLLKFSAYLTPLSLLLAELVNRKMISPTGRSVQVGFLTAFCLLGPFSYLPLYTNIAYADGYVTEYLEDHPSYYGAGIIAFRDAYFYRNEFDKADQWEWQLPIKSQEHLNFRGCTDLIAAERNSEALSVLATIVIQNPYWTEPRQTIASVQLALNRAQLAKPQIDTCLMLQPYNPDHHIYLYRYYQATGRSTEVEKGIAELLILFPENTTILTDQMILYQRSARPQEADSLADLILRTDSSLAFPYAIKGLIAEGRYDTANAIRYYEAFVGKSPETESELPVFRKRLNNLVVQQNSQ